MKMEKVILTEGKLENDVGIVNYTESFLKNIANQKSDVNVELNQHNGEIISKVERLRYDDGKLYATVDIPDEYIVDGAEIGWSTDIIPNSYTSNDGYFDLNDGVLQNIVFLNDLNNTFQPNDKNTISRLLNIESDTMSDDLNKMYGKLQQKYETLKDEHEKLSDENKKIRNKLAKTENKFNELKDKYVEGESLYNKGKAEYEKVLEIANKYKEEKANKKKELINKLVPENEKGERDEFKLNMFNKLTNEELESLINDEKVNKPSTPPNGASGNGVSDFNEEQGSENESESYLEIKDAFNL